MQIGNCWLRIDPHGSNVYKRGVSPAEVAILRDGFRLASKEPAITTVFVTHDKVVNHTSEMTRLRYKYRDLRNEENKHSIEVCYPGMAKLPERFDELADLNVEKIEPQEYKPNSSPDTLLSEQETLSLDAVNED